jgi:hypothetical protein
MGKDVPGYVVGIVSAGVYPNHVLLTAGTVKARAGPTSPSTQE